jgi:proteasome assembly chaperone (PAC2) family protein
VEDARLGIVGASAALCPVGQGAELTAATLMGSKSGATGQGETTRVPLLLSNWY